MSPLPHELAARVDGLLGNERRVILGITGPPGTGKSTLAASIVDFAAGRGVAGVHVPMDGFHLADIELARLGRRNRKGAIDTFDGHGYVALIERIRSAPPHVVYAPGFDRDIEQPIAGRIAVLPEHRLVVTEGNYLLDDEHPWNSVPALLSEVWFVDSPPEQRRHRLVARHVEFGKSSERAAAWVAAVDEPNAERIQTTRHKADLNVPLQMPSSGP